MPCRHRTHTHDHSSCLLWLANILPSHLPSRRCARNSHRMGRVCVQVTSCSLFNTRVAFARVATSTFSMRVLCCPQKSCCCSRSYAWHETFTQHRLFEDGNASCVRLNVPTFPCGPPDWRSDPVINLACACSTPFYLCMTCTALRFSLTRRIHKLRSYGKMYYISKVPVPQGAVLNSPHRRRRVIATARLLRVPPFAFCLTVAKSAVLWRSLCADSRACGGGIRA